MRPLPLCLQYFLRQILRIWSDILSTLRSFCQLFQDIQQLLFASQKSFIQAFKGTDDEQLLLQTSQEVLVSVFRHVEGSGRLDVDMSDTFTNRSSSSLLVFIQIEDCSSVLSLCWVWTAQCLPLSEHCFVVDQIFY